MLLIASGAASAEWEGVGGDSKFYWYVDRATIRRDGDSVKMWSLRNFKVDLGGDMLSGKEQWEYDCKNERAWLIFYNMYSGQMGSGDSKLTSKGGSWLPIEPGSIYEALWKIACGKK